MIVPGQPTDPIQLIDVRDLADWIIHCIENNVVGVYNKTRVVIVLPSELVHKRL